ncbi:MAG TPA: hypothetical protein VHM28_05330, partial [Anaerolineales bacterium]|nr:hypothetical protein [Anaerolineales bacterium]
MDKDQQDFKEPSVLDFVKSKLPFRRGTQIEIPESPQAETTTEVRLPTAKDHPSRVFPWLSLIALVLALIGQRSFEPPNASALNGIAFYLSGFALLIFAILRGEWTLAPLKESSEGNDPYIFRRVAFLASIPFAVLAFLSFSGNLFNSFNLSIGLIALGLFVFSLWARTPNENSFLRKIKTFVSKDNWHINISRWTLLIVAASVLIIFFRIYHIQQTPAEPFSDHAEKLLDVYDVSQGQTHIFFPRNTGREAIQMYWTVLMSWVFGTGLSFLSLKIGTVLFGLFTLPYIYLLGKEIGGPRVGLIAFVFAGISYWPNVIARIGLRFPLYPLFVAPLMYYLIRGLRTRQRN